MLNELQAYKNQGNPVKERWLSYIDNKSVSLDERWAAFLEAPSEWKKTDMTASIPYACLRAIGLDSPYDDLLIERGETHDVEQDVEHIEMMIGDTDFNEELNADHIIQMKEEIIATRMYEWTFDW